MKLTSEQIAVINRYTDAERIDREKLIAYLEKHKIIKGDVFKHCSKVVERSLMASRGYCTFLNSEPTYTPVDRNTFIRRIPFYFTPVHFGSEQRSGLSYIIPVSRQNERSAEFYEAFYRDLEWMYYELEIPLERIFGYIRDQVCLPPQPKKDCRDSFSSAILEEHGLGVRESFEMWRDYLHMCSENSSKDFMPERFITSYNYALEACGRDPIIYRPLKNFITYLARDGSSYVCEGNFPCDASGTPILKWTTLRVTNPVSVEFSADKSRKGELRINFGPKTIIYAKGLYDDPDNDDETDDEPEWEQVYAGPQTMEFNHEALREYRIARKMTQNDVAEAIGTSVRTYQKWEGGDTTPDGHNLLRLMNWLEITDVQSLIIYRDCPD